MGTWRLFDSSTTIQLGKFKDLVFGGSTENFKRHRRILRRYKVLKNQKEKKNEPIKLKEDIWTAWKCVSLVSTNGQTLDLTIGNEATLMSFIHCMYSIIFRPA